MTKKRTTEQAVEDTDLDQEEPSEEAEASAETDGERPGVAKLVSGIQDEAGKAIRSLLDRNPVGTEAVERLFEIAVRMLNRREVLERILHSEFMKNVRDMQSEITESVGLASQSDVDTLRTQLTEVLERLEKLQSTLDDIVVEVDSTEE